MCQEISAELIHASFYILPLFLTMSITGVPPKKGVEEILSDMDDTGDDFFEIFDNGKIFEKIIYHTYPDIFRYMILAPIRF